MPENETFLEASSGPAESPANLEPEAAQAAESADAGEMAAALEASSIVAHGSILRGPIVNITPDVVFVDLGLKSEAALSRVEFTSPEGQLTVQPGEEIDVWVEKYDEQTGSIIVSYRKALNEKIWRAIEEAFQNQTNLRGRVVERVKGGLAVNAGVPVFLPGSQADVRPHPNLDTLIGQEIEFKVIKLNRKRANVVISRKLALEEDLQKRRAELAGQLVEGAELTGRVKNLTDYGVFVDLGGSDGLIHITDLAWGRVGHPSEVVQPGQEIRVKILKFDPEKQRVSLGVKQLSPDPWDHVPETYHSGDKVKGRIVSVTDYGAFAELEPGVEGLIHISEMSWSKSLRHPSKIVKPGDFAELTILEVNMDQRRISLSLRQALPDPWSSLAERYPVGSVTQGRVRHLTDFGAFVELEEGIDGLVHVSNLSWAKNVKHPSEVVRKGQKLDVVILGVDSEKRRLSLGLKQLQPDIWEDFFSKVTVGATVHGKVIRLASFGAFVELAEGIEGLCHVSEYSDDGASTADHGIAVGSELDFRVLRLTPDQKKIALTLRKSEALAPAPPAPAKLPEPPVLSRMAEAFSSAGITTSASAAAQRQTEK